MIRKGIDYIDCKDLIGKKVRVTSTTNGHGVPKGTIITITSAYNRNPDQFCHSFNSTIIKATNIEIFSETIAEIKKENKILSDKLSKNKAKLKFMKDQDLDEFDPQLFKIYAALSVIESTDSQIDKAKAITELIDGQ